MRPTIHCGYLPGCIGRISELHARYYHPLVGFGLTFEARVARELAQFCESFDQSRDGLWLLLDGDRVEGSIAIDGSKADSEGAHLRWFITSENMRGSGHGASLISRAMEFCESKNYSQVHLSTFEGLDAARHLYEKFGFALISEQRGTQWGAEVQEQGFLWRAQNLPSRIRETDSHL